MFLFHVFNSCFKLWFNSCFHLGFNIVYNKFIKRRVKDLIKNFYQEFYILILHTYFYQEFYILILHTYFIMNFTSLFYAIFYILILHHFYEYEVSVKITVLDPDPNSIYLLLINRDFDQWMIFVI